MFVRNRSTRCPISLAALGVSDWLPPNIDYRCLYIRNFQKIVGLYELKQTSSELREIQEKEIETCN
jgi:hypothetical protein